MGFSDLFSSGGSSTDSVSDLSPEQQQLNNDTSAWINGYVRNGTPNFRGGKGREIAQLDPRINEYINQYLNNGLSNFETTQPYLNQMASGESTYNYDPEGVASEWEQNFAKPLMKVWNDVLRPQVEESYNIPGVFSSTVRSKGVARSGQETLDVASQRLFDAQQAERSRAFASAEGAKDRQLPAIQALQGSYGQAIGQIAAVGEIPRGIEQQGYDSSYQQYARLNPSWAELASAAIGLGTAGTRDTVVNQEPDRIGQLLGAGAMAGGAWIGAQDYTKYATS